MKQINLALILCLFSITCYISSCSYGLKCDINDEINLGTLSYSDEFNEWNIEKGNGTIAFETPQGIISFEEKPESYKLSKLSRANSYLVCKSKGISSQNYYAYYEYENRTVYYSSDKAIISIAPDISVEGKDEIGESLYVNVSYDNKGLKGRLPITNGELMNPTENDLFGQLFTFYETLNVGDRTFSDVWKLENDRNSAIYYNKTKGILAFKISGEYWYKK